MRNHLRAYDPNSTHPDSGHPFFKVKEVIDRLNLCSENIFEETDQYKNIDESLTKYFGRVPGGLYCRMDRKVGLTVKTRYIFA